MFLTEVRKTILLSRRLFYKQLNSIFSCVIKIGIYILNNVLHSLMSIQITRFIKIDSVDDTRVSTRHIFFNLG